MTDYIIYTVSFLLATPSFWRVIVQRHEALIIDYLVVIVWAIVLIAVATKRLTI
jgi:uncharacterized membrane protein YkgB